MSHRDRTAWLRRVSNGFAGLAAAGSSLDRQKIAAIRAIATIEQRSRAAYPPTPQLKRQQSPVARFGQAEASYHAISNTWLAHGYLSSSPLRPATQSGLCGEEVAPATCGLAHAQQGDRVRRMGVLMVQAAEDPEGQARLAESGSRRSSVNSA